MFLKHGTGGFSEIKPSTEIERAADTAYHALQGTHDDSSAFLFRRAPILRPQHGVTQNKLALLRGQLGLQNHCFIFVTLTALEHGSRAEAPQTAFGPIEQRAEENVAVIIRQAPPIDCAVGS